MDAKRGAVEEAEWIEMVREWEKEKPKERREAMVWVEVMRKGGGGGERSEAEMARKGRAVGVEGLRGKETERRGEGEVWGWVLGFWLFAKEVVGGRQGRSSIF
jgi:hypothetical protein